MHDNEYWDEGEFNFFNTLEDVDKLLYVYDLMVGEFVHEYNGEHIDNVFEIEFEEEPMDEIRQDVTLQFTSDGKIMFTGSELTVLMKVANDMMLNGLILSNQNVEFTKYEPWDVILTFDLIGEGYPISLN